MFDSGDCPDGVVARTFYAPSFALSGNVCGYYGVGHTAWRQPGDMRGTVVGKKGRFKAFCEQRGGDVIA
jgi:hypothetical protein